MASPVPLLDPPAKKPCKIPSKPENHCACCVPGCSQSEFKSPGLSFHSFPTDSKQRNAWIAAIHRDPGRTFEIRRGSTYVCSTHFKKEDYKWTPVRKNLKKTAVPSVFDHCEGWEKLNNGQYKFARKPPRDRPFVISPSSPSTTTTASLPSSNNDITQTILEDTPPSLSAEEELQLKIKDLEEKLKEKVVQLDKKDKLLKTLENSLSLERWGINRFSQDDDMVKFYTGFTSYELFIKFYESVKPTATNLVSAYYVRAGEKRSLAGRPRTMLLIDELFMFLMRLRQAFPEKDLGQRFHITEQTVSRKIITWTSLLYLLLGSLPIWLSREETLKSMPPCFKKQYPTTRVIIDCTEIPTQYASSLVLNSQLYSNYKSRPTFKCLVGCAPNGVFTFISHLFCGSMSDVAIVKLSGLLDLLEEGDMIMADKGFKIAKLLEGKGVELNLPPFLCNMQQFTPEEVQQTEEIASARIHVERAIGRVKEFKIFDKVPLSMTGSINQIWVVACILTAFQPPLIKAR